MVTLPFKSYQQWRTVQDSIKNEEVWLMGVSMRSVVDGNEEVWLVAVIHLLIRLPLPDNSHLHG